MNLDHGERGDSAKCSNDFPRIAAFAVVMLFAASSFAASVEQKKGELQDLKGRIKDLRRDVAAAEKSKTSVADQLRETESAISDTSRRLHQLSAESTEAKQQLASLDAQKRRLDQQAGTQQQQLAQVLNRQFVSNESDALKLLLSGHDPNQTARDRYFLTQLSRAKAELLKQLRTVAAEKKTLAEDTRQRQAELAAIERQQQESRAHLLARKKQRVATLAKIGDRLKAQRREIDSLKRDQQRLAKLISELARAAAAKRAAPRDPPADDTKVGAGGTAIGNTSRIKSYEPGHVEGAFAALRGKLALPVKGQIVGRFGHTREAGGASWRGLFIRATEGVMVKAVAGGAVVFSDWLRGFGNLLIIDHGDDFLSVYANNESLLASAGSTVKSGEPVATVGNSGGNPDSGLYFELRHRGQPFDPLKWAGNQPDSR